MPAGFVPALANDSVQPLTAPFLRSLPPAVPRHIQKGPQVHAWADDVPAAHMCRLSAEHGQLRRHALQVKYFRTSLWERFAELTLLTAPNRCRTCTRAICEDCLPEGDIDAVGDTLPELCVILLGFRSHADRIIFRPQSG